MPSPTATADPTNTPTPTLIPPPDDFSKIRLVSFGQYPDWRFQFTFEFPSPVKGSYKVQTVNPRKEFPCRPLLEYNQPKRMVCLGRTPAVEKVVDYNVVDTASGAVLFSGQVSILFQ